MATITSAASGLASATSTWVGSVVPTEGDKVIIAAGHVVTLDGTFTWGDDSVTATLPNAAVNVYGTLKASRLVNSSLTGKGLILLGQGNTTGLDYGTVGDPIPAGITAHLILNKATTPAVRMGLQQSTALTAAGNGANIYMHSADTRMRGVPLASTAAAAATTLPLTTSAHNWQVGDTVLLFTTTNNTNTNECEFRTISAISGATITISAGLTYPHLAGSPVANMTSNIVVRSFNEVAGQTARVDIRAPNNSAAGNDHNFQFTGVEFRNVGQNSGGLIEAHTNSTLGVVRVDFVRCALYNNINTGTQVTNATWTQFPVIDGCAVYVTGSLSNAGNAATIKNSYLATTSAPMGNGSICQDTWITSLGGSAIFAESSRGNNIRYSRITLSGNAVSLGQPSTAGLLVEDSDLGATYGWRMTFGQGAVADFGPTSLESIELKDCLLHPRFLTPDSPSSGIAGRSEFVRIAYVNKARDVTQQEIWYGAGAVKRENTIKNRGTSSIALGTYSTVRPLTRTQSIPCAAGSTIRIVGYVRMDTAYWNAGDNNLPTVTLTGLGATPVTFTASAAANNAWEKFDISITNSSGNDGNFTLTYTASAKTVSTGTVYFDGVPDAPFITKVRHYGFTFNETSPTREVNIYTVASESTAAAYTGTTINAGTKRVTFGIGTADTLNKVYDYSQAWAVQNIALEVPWTRAGALLSLTDGWAVVDPVITGVTWGGGTIEYSAPGNIEASFDSCVLEFTTAGTYSMGDSTFAGTVELVNTSGGAVTVELPSGTSFTNTGPSITVTTPVLYQSVTINGLVTGSRVYIYDTVTSTVLSNGIAASSSYTWTDSVAASANRNIWLRVAYQSGTNAKKFIDVAIGTAGTTALTAAVTYLVNQEDDGVYIANAIDGSTVTGISIDDAIDRVVISIAGGSVTWPEIYAYQVYWLATSAGIIDDAAFITAPDTANYLLSGFQIRNTSTVPLTITGGYGRDATTETVAACIDTAGSTGNIFPAPDHVVPFSTGSGLTAGQAAQLAALNTSAVNVVSIQGQLINGSGTASDPWGP